MVERFNRQLKNSLRAWLASSDWFEHLHWVSLDLRAMIPPLLLQKLSMVLRQNQLYEDLRNSMSGFHPVLAHPNIPPACDFPEQLPAFLLSCPMVFVRKVRHVPP